MYSGQNDVCGVPYPHRTGGKICLASVKVNPTISTYTLLLNLKQKYLHILTLTVKFKGNCYAVLLKLNELSKSQI